MKKFKYLIILIFGLLGIITMTSCNIGLRLITSEDDTGDISDDEDDLGTDDSNEDTGDGTDNSEDSDDNTFTGDNTDESEDALDNNGAPDDTNTEDNTGESEDTTHGFVTYDHTGEELPYKFEYDSETTEFNIYYKDGTLLDDYLVYSSTDMYDEFATLDNKEDMQIAYLNALAKSLVFSLYDYDAPAYNSKYYTAFNVKMSTSEYNITSDECVTIWVAIESDHPQLYWIENTYLQSYSYVSFFTNANYDTYEERSVANQTVIDSVSDISNSITTTSEYRRIKKVYDYVIQNTEYAYLSDGKTASSELDAHSIMGFFNGGNVVCEGYAKVLQIIYNYMGIANHYVRGYVGNDSSTNYHAFNYVCYNNKWYFCDSTNDDDGSLTYEFFLAGSDTMNSYSVHPFTGELATFGYTYQYTLPELSASDYSKSIL